MAYFAWHPVKIIHEVVFCFTFSDEVDWWVCCSLNDGSVADKTHLFTWVLLPFQNYFIWSRLFPLLLRMVLRDERYFGAGLCYCSVPRENHVINSYSNVTCKCNFYLKVGRENYHQNAQGTRLRRCLPAKFNLFREFCGYHKSWKQNFWLCQNGRHVNCRHENEISIGQHIIFPYAWGRS